MKKLSKNCEVYVGKSKYVERTRYLGPALQEGHSVVEDTNEIQHIVPTDCLVVV